MRDRPKQRILYPIHKLVDAIEPLDRPSGQMVITGMWAQPEGRGLPGVVNNLILAVDAEMRRVGLANEPDLWAQVHLDELRSWSQGLNAIRAAILVLDDQPRVPSEWANLPEGKNTHPLSGHGFTSHSLYAAAWSLQETRSDPGLFLGYPCAAYRRLQWWWIRVQTRLIEDRQISWVHYLPAYPAEIQEGNGANKTEAEAIDHIKIASGISFDSVGRALRRMSRTTHRALLALLVECCLDDLDAGLNAFMRFDEKINEWKSPDAGLQKERQTFVDSFRLAAEKLLDPSAAVKHRSRHGRLDGDGGSDINVDTKAGKSDQSGSGHAGGRQTLWRVEQPEALSELQHWIPGDEVLGQMDPDEPESDDGVEAPRRTGLTLVDPADIKGHMARAKSQSHHLAMVRQGFAWDSNTLSSSERRVLRELVEQVCTSLDTCEPAEWWPKAMVAVSWVCGRPLEEVVKLACLNQQDMLRAQEDLFAVGEIDGVFCWRWPLRLPNRIQVETFSQAVPRVDHVLVPDGSGLAAILVRAHRMRTGSRSQVFGWLLKPEQRLAKALEVTRGLKGPVIDRTVTPSLLSRDLRITLLNLAPDKTVAWMLAGTEIEAREPRMFYAAHAPDELIRWVHRAHERMGIPALASSERAPQSAPAVWPESYAGAKFLAEITALRSLVWQARAVASTFPPLNFVHQKLLKHAAKTKVGRTRAAPPELPRQQWTDVWCWRQWHDDVVFWVWLVQALQTSQRATRNPVGVYLQWLQEPKREWVSLEDKRTADRDESRSGVITPMLSSAFALLTHVQAAYRGCWEPRAKRKPKGVKPPDGTEKRPKEDEGMPFGFCIFDGAQKPSELAPAWIRSHLESRFGLLWPVNFNRATLRRALSQLGLDGDGLDAFLGHGAIADRVHDRHSLFDVAAYHTELRAALKLWADQLDMTRLDLPTNRRPTASRQSAHCRAAIRAIKQQAQTVAPAKSRPRPSKEIASEDFARWQEYVAQQLDLAVDARTLEDLKSWHAHLLKSGLPFAHHVLGLPSGLAVHMGPHNADTLKVLHDTHRGAAQALENVVIEWVSVGDMSRQVAAHGLNLSYRLCKAIDASLPTMRVAMTAHARVSPFTVERIAQAERADRWRESCLEALRSPRVNLDLLEKLTGRAPSESEKKSCEQEEAKINLALCSFLNVTAENDRWMSCVRTLLESPVARQHVFDAPYEFSNHRHDGRMRECRGLLSVLSTQVNPLPTLPDDSPVRMRDLYRIWRPESAVVATQLAPWITGIRRYAYMVLPPLIAACQDGSLSDQSVQGPLARALGWTGTARPDKARRGHDEVLDEGADEPGVMPPMLFDKEDTHDPYGWVPSLVNMDLDADTWLRSFLWEIVGEPSDTTTLEDLSDGLLDAFDEVPSKYRRRVIHLIAAHRAHHGLPEDERANTRADRVDRHVIDFATYNKVLAELEKRTDTSRMPSRQSRMRLLIVLAFRLGMRRREILYLRKGDVDLEGDGRIHIRPYVGHTLKTGFSRRSLPIAPLLKEQERQWLSHAVMGSGTRPDGGALSDLLIPQIEHDTLSRDAIKLLQHLGKDDRLKLHHLRHSFASWMALKIVFARRPEWAEVFAGHPEMYAETITSPNLVGTVLKPKLSAGDFLVIPRMLGHSSYEVSLTNYVHTMDLVSALFVQHKLTNVIVPQRDQGSLIKRRYSNAVVLQKQSVTGYVHALPVAPNGSPGDGPPATWSDRVEEVLVAMKMAGASEDSRGVGGNSLLISLREIQNWHSPLQSFALKAKLQIGVNRLNDEEMVRLVKLGHSYWRNDPPMFWFSARRIDKPQGRVTREPELDSRGSAMAQVRQALTDLLGILRCMNLSEEEVFFWRYSRASATEHGGRWDDLIAANGFKPVCGLLGGSAKSVEALGVSLGCLQARRSPLPGVLCRALACAPTLD